MFLAPVFLLGCIKDDILKDPHASINFSKDTLMFDTVFTSIGSATKYLMVYNKNSKPVIIKTITLAGGKSSPFKVNVDGIPGPVVNDVEIAANDSAYVIVQVYTNPKNQNSPVLVSDSLLFNLNGNTQNVKFEAWGQDIHLIRDSALKTQTWHNDKPYLIKDLMIVDSSETLTIEAGAKIYMHKNAIIAVYGTLLVNGMLGSPVIFRGDRLDNLNTVPPVPYDKIPNQWERIWLANSSTGNKFNYAEIRNGNIGLQVGAIGTTGTASVVLSDCIIEDHSSAGILAINSKITADDCLIDNCGSCLFGCWAGGYYEFYQCTLANYYVWGEQNGVAILLQDYYQINDTLKGSGDLKKAYFGNCIVYGAALDEVVFNFKKNQSYVFDNCLLKGEADYYTVADKQKFIDNYLIKQEYNPGFKLIDIDNINYNFQLTKTSDAKDEGNLNIAEKYPIDLLGNSRLADGYPDIGAYEYTGTGK